MQRAELLSSTNVGNGKFHDQKPNVLEAQPENRPESMSQDLNKSIPKPVYQGTGLNKEGLTVDLSQKRMVPQVSNDTGIRGPENSLAEPVPGPIRNEPGPMLNSNPGHDLAGVSVPQMAGHQMGVNQVRPPADNGATTLFVGELHWWTTDAELENVLSQYGRVKEIKFFDERASGKSKGYCQVDFYDASSAAACKDGMNGYAEPPGRRPMNDLAGRGGGNNFSGGDTGRNYGRGNWGRGGGQGNMNRGNMRGRGGMGPKNVNAPGLGGGPAGGGYPGPAFGGPPGRFMHPQGMMGGGFDPTYMGRGAGYGVFPGSGFPGMMPQFLGVNPMGLAGVAPHVNPAFFGHGMGGGGMGMMGTGGMEGPQAGMWGDTEHEYGGGEASHEKVTTTKSNAVSREKEREWSGNSEKRHREERDQTDRDRYHKDYKYKDEKDSYRDHHRHKDRNTD
ncbi:hypothetical protein QVD17_21270 [Tagetes erecta]|uniref:RRM domain-containing protein n=1 Tax=Tagetes erecta TaxID=13708 RepID=A0AAD8KN79_TARER|nr:hypothetical protein QVD17_21270 [Tagetes erecta]